MPDVGGNHQRVHNWTSDANASINIDAARFDAENDDFSASLTARLMKTGANSPTANLPMATFLHTAVGNATLRNQYAAAGQVQDGAFNYNTSGGSAGAFTLSVTPAISAYVAGMFFIFNANHANTGAATLAVSGLSAISLRKFGSTNLAANDIQTNDIVMAVYDGTNFQIVSFDRQVFDLNGVEFILDVDGDSSLQVSVDDRLDVKLQNVVLFRFDGTVASPVNGIDFVASATGTHPGIQAVGSDANLNVNLIPKGTGKATVAGAEIPTGASIVSLAGVAIGAGGLFAYSTSANTWASAAITAAGRAIIDDATAGDQRTTLGVVIGTDVAAQSHVGASGTAVHAAATDSLAGFVELATPAEAKTGSDTTRAVTAAGVTEAKKTLNGVVTDTTTSRTLALGDENKLILMNNAGANDVKIPTNASVAFDIGDQFLVAQYGAGATTISAVTPGTTDVRFDAALTGQLNAQYAVGGTVKIGTDEWIAFGNLLPA